MANSWQQPVAGEPQLGQPHLHYNELVNTDPAATGWTAVDCSGQIPVGSTLIGGHCHLTATDAGSEVTFHLATSGTEYMDIDTQVANQEICKFFIIPVTSSRTFTYYISNSNISNITIQMTLYWC